MIDKNNIAAEDSEVESVLDDGTVVRGWKQNLKKMIEDPALPDTLGGLLMVFMQIGTALQNYMPKKDLPNG